MFNLLSGNGLWGTQFKSNKLCISNMDQYLVCPPFKKIRLVAPVKLTDPVVVKDEKVIDIEVDEVRT